MLLSDKQDLMERLRAILHRCGGIDAGAQVLGIEKSTLRNRLTATNSDHHLRVWDLLLLLDHAADAGEDAAPIVEFIARRYGFLLVRAPGATVEGDAIHAQMSRVAKEVGDVANKLIKITDPNSAGGSNLTATEVETLGKEVSQAQTALAQLLELAKSALPDNVAQFPRRGA